MTSLTYLDSTKLCNTRPVSKLSSKTLDTFEEKRMDFANRIILTNFLFFDALFTIENGHGIWMVTFQLEH